MITAVKNNLAQTSNQLYHISVQKYYTMKSDSYRIQMFF